MTVRVKIERTATVTITLDEKEAAYLAALVGNVGCPHNNVAGQACRDIYSALLSDR